MNLVRPKPVDVWQSCAGLCTICGMPLGLEPIGQLTRETQNTEVINAEYEDPWSAKKKDETDEMQDLSIALSSSLQIGDTTIPADWEEDEDAGRVQENFVRVSLFKYNLLGSLENCHVIDRYTFLKNEDSFYKALKDNERIVKVLGGNLLEDLQKPSSEMSAVPLSNLPGQRMFDKAADYCQRIAAKVVIPGCKACNAAMNRSGAHADIVYRCFPPTSHLNIPELEDSLTKTGRVVSKGVAIKKLIQQIALYFRPPSPVVALPTKKKTGKTTISESNKISPRNQPEQHHWMAREDDEIMPLAALWRCVANLCMWGKSGFVRFRLVAIFYASVYIYEQLMLKDVILFLDWHIHVFRMYYMTQYSESGTFFGMPHSRASLTFDTTLKSGPLWCEIVQNEYLHKAAKDLEVYFRDKVDVMKIFEFKEFFRAHIQSEKTLFCFLSKRAGVNEGVNSIMSFFMYNFQGPASTLLHTRGAFFIKDIKIQVKREIQQLSLPSHHSKKKQEALF